MLWGAHAQAKAPLVAAAGGSHRVLQCNHPSPLSATRGHRCPSSAAGTSARRAASSRPPNRARPPDWRLDLPVGHCEEARTAGKR